MNKKNRFFRWLKQNEACRSGIHYCRSQGLFSFHDAYDKAPSEYFLWALSCEGVLSVQQKARAYMHIAKYFLRSCNTPLEEVGKAMVELFSPFFSSSSPLQKEFIEKSVRDMLIKISSLPFPVIKGILRKFIENSVCSLVKEDSSESTYYALRSGAYAVSWCEGILLDAARDKVTAWVRGNFTLSDFKVEVR